MMGLDLKLCDCENSKIYSQTIKIQNFINKGGKTISNMVLGVCVCALWVLPWLQQS